MNSNVQIISKGLYRGRVDISFPIKVKEYVFTRQDEKKCLLLRFFNDSQLNITALHFWLVQKNSHGEQIGKEKISLEGIYCAQGEIFVPVSGFFVDDKCADFDIEMISAFSGEYEYKTKNGEIFVQYPIEYEQTAVVKKKAYCVQHKKLNNKVKFSSAILVLAIFLVIFIIFWPFFKEEIWPLIVKITKAGLELLEDALKSLFKKIGNLFDK